MGEALLIAEGLSKQFGGINAVDGVDLSLAKGELRCIIGPNGAGKSTLFNMIAGTLRPTAGLIRFDGRDMSRQPVHAFARHGIGRKFQVPSLFSSMTATENLEVACRVGIGAGERSRRVAEMLSTLGLTEQAGVAASALAHGQKQWLEIGMVLMAEPHVLLLDEPTAGMTGEETQKTAQLLQDFQGRLAVVVIEHDMRFVRALACRTTVMHQGRIISEGSYDEIERDELVRDVYLGRQ